VSKCFWAGFVTAIALSPGAIASENEETGPVLVLERAIRMALSHNPELKAVALNRQAAAAERVQAGLRPNPVLDVAVENVAGGGPYTHFDGAETTLSLGQLIELAGKREKRREAAGLNAALAHWDYEAKRCDLITATYLAFIDVLAEQRRVSLHQDLFEIARQVSASVAARLEAGKVSPLEAAKAEIAVSNARMQWLQGQERLKVLRSNLAGYWATDRLAFSRVEGELDQISQVPSKEQLDDLILQNPDVARWVTEIDLRRARLELERAQSVPDVTVTLGYRQLSEFSENTWVAGLALPLPLFNRNQGNIQKARHLLSQGEWQREAAENRTRLSLAEALQSLKTAYDQAKALRDQVRPAAELVFEGTRLGYREGKFGLLETLDAQRTYFEVAIQYLDWLARYQRQKALLERLIGRPLPQVKENGEVGNE